MTTSAPTHELERLRERQPSPAAPIGEEEYRTRQAKLRRVMREAGLDAMLLPAGANLRYFTGLDWPPSERLVCALLSASRDPVYIAPAFERGTLHELLPLDGQARSWEEHESPYRLCADALAGLGIKGGRIGLAGDTPLFVFDALTSAAPAHDFANAQPQIDACRTCKSRTEIALMQQANDITIAVHAAAAQILRPGITTAEVAAFINEAHRAAGAAGGSAFCIVLFGPDTAFPHGVKTPKPLEDGDVVLIDTGCRIEGYHSDITRSYVFGRASAHQRAVWNAEKAAQAVAFDAAQLGRPCAEVDRAVRIFLESEGFGPGYALPGLPHRTGHGTGLDIHEPPYLVGSDSTPLAPGMCFSNEPMLCLPGEFGIRLEDHFYMTEAGPRWFTEPADSIDAPFGPKIVPIS